MQNSPALYYHGHPGLLHTSTSIMEKGMGLRWATGSKKQPRGEQWGTCEGGINCYGAPKYKQRIPYQPCKSSQSSHPEAPEAENSWCSLSEYPQPLGKKLCSLDFSTRIHEPAITPILFMLPTCNSIKAGSPHIHRKDNYVSLPHLSEIHFSAFFN